MGNKTQQGLIFVARVLLGLAFLGGAITKISDWSHLSGHIARTPLKDAIGDEMIPVYLVFTILIEGLGGLLLVLGAKTRFAALFLIMAFLVPLFYFDNFWNLSGTAFIHGYFRFLTDVKVLAALMFVLAFGPGRISVDGA